MNRLHILILVIIIAFISCDGRDRAYLTNEDILQENKLLDSFSENIQYIPEAYSEAITDTILSNGFRVKIKTYTDLNKNVSLTNIKDSITYTKHYRNYKFDVLIEKENKVIYQKFFDKNVINNEMKLFKSDLTKDSPYFNFDKLAVLKSIEIDDEPSLKEMVVINLMYIIPNTKRFSTHSLMVNENGDANFIHLKVN